MTTYAHKRMFALVSAIVLFASLVGCVKASSDPDRTIAHVESKIERVDGIEKADLTIRATRDGFTLIVWATAVIRLEAEAVLEDTSSMADYLIRSLWSISDRRPTVLSVFVEDADGVRVDISAGAVEAGWNPITRHSPFIVLHRLDTEPVRSKLGAWPGRAPEPPVDAIARRAVRSAFPP